MINEPALVAGTEGMIVAVNDVLRAMIGGIANMHSPLHICDVLEIDKSELLLPAGAETRLETRIKGDRYAGNAVTAVIRPVYVQDCQKGYCLKLEYPEPGVATGFAALKPAIESFPHGAIIWDGNTRLYAANEIVREKYRQYDIELKVGDRREDVLAVAVDKGLWGSEVKAAASEELGQRSRDVESQKTSVRFEKVDTQGWLKMTTYPSRQKWLLSFYEDLSERDFVEERLQRITWYHTGILKYLPDFLVHLSHKGVIEYINAAFLEQLGFQAEDIIGKSDDNLLEKMLGISIGDMLKQVTPEEPKFSFDQRFEKDSGEFVWIRWRAHVLFDDQNKCTGIVATGRDISVEYRQQMNLRHQSEELEKKNRSLEQFAAVVSHDLKAPLRHVSIFADMIVEEADKGNLEDVTTYATQVVNSAKRMDRVIKRLLEYSQIAYRILSPVQVNLADITIQAIQNLESQIEEAHAEVLLSKLPSFYGDPDLLRHLMQNLIANAVKYRRAGARPRINIYAMEEGSNISLFVEDNGIGIDPKYADSIFTAFQRLHRDDKVYDGFGVGLALCRQIVESHNGKIELDTSYRTGTRIVVRLPREWKRFGVTS